MRADAPDAAGAVRVLLASVGCNRAARGGLRRMDSRSVAARPVLHHARSHGRDDVLAAEDHADIRRPDAAAHDDDHAARLQLHVSPGAERAGDLLVRQQSVGNRPAVLHELADWTADRARRPPARGTPPEERGLGTDETRGKAILVDRTNRRGCGYIEPSTTISGVCQRNGPLYFFEGTLHEVRV